ncbi:hypothetical protein Tco_0620606 [Tanacetum coccineum]
MSDSDVRFGLNIHRANVNEARVIVIGSASFEVTYTSIIIAWRVPLVWAGNIQTQRARLTDAARHHGLVLALGCQSRATLSQILHAGTEYPEYFGTPFFKEHVEDQPYVVADSPIALSPGYVADLDLEEDSKDGPVDYPADGGDGDDDDSTIDDEEGKRRLLGGGRGASGLLPRPNYYEHPLLTTVPSLRRQIVETDESAAYNTHHHWHRSALARVFWFAPLNHHHHYTSTIITTFTTTCTYIITITIITTTTTTSLTVYTTTSRPVREDKLPEAELPPRKRLCLTALTLRYEVGESLTAAPRPTGGHRTDYGFIDTLDAETRCAETPRLSYAMIEDTQDRHTRIFQSVEALIDNRQYHYETARLLD